MYNVALQALVTNRLRICALLPDTIGLLASVARIKGVICLVTTDPCSIAHVSDNVVERVVPQWFHRKLKIFSRLLQWLEVKGICRTVLRAKAIVQLE